MNITYCERYVQIELTKDTRLLEKVLEYASKHFSKRYHLSSSLLILDDGERFKKDYLINWIYHAMVQDDSVSKISEQKSARSRKSSKLESKQKTQDAKSIHTPEELKEILAHSHLPIRIKITNPNDVLKRVKIHIHFSNLGQMIVRLEENDRVARRYIYSLFGDKIVYEVDNEFCINSAGYSESMWEGIIELISSRVIHNVALEFEYQKGESGNDSFLTREEYLLRKCYSELNVEFGDDLKKVKKQYLKLAKIFHPDNAHGKDPYTIELYQDRFKRISDAYQMIKNAKASERTTA